MACLNADSVKKVGHVHCLYQEINSNFAYDDNGIYGYRRKVDGADTVFPFSDLSMLKQKVYEKQSGTTGYTNFYLDIIIDEDVSEGLLFVDSWINTASADFTISDGKSGPSQYFKITTTSDNTCGLYFVKSSISRNIRITQKYDRNYNNRFIKVYLLY